jgi:hypothetical protein
MIGISPSFATQTIRKIDLVSLVFLNNATNSSSIYKVASNLTSQSVPYWNSILSQSSSRIELALGIQDFSPVALEPLTRCDGNTLYRKGKDCPRNEISKRRF